MPILFNFHILFGNFLYYFWDKHIDTVPSASSCLLHVFGFAEYPYQTESKRDKNRRSLFLENMENSEGKSTRTSARGGHEVGGAPPLGYAPTLMSPP